MVNRTFLYSLGAIALIVVFVGLFTMGSKGTMTANDNLGGQASLAASSGDTRTSPSTDGKIINAHECRADSLCEVNDLLSSQGVTAQTGTFYQSLIFAKQQDEAMIQVISKSGTGGAGIEMKEAASGGDWKVKATSDGSFKIRNHKLQKDVITIDPGNQVFIEGVANPLLVIKDPTEDEAGISLVSSGNGVEWKVASTSYGDFKVQNMMTGEDIFVINDMGNAQFTKMLKVNEELKIVPLAGSGDAYACINSEGILYRSINPCAGGTTNQEVLNMLNSCSFFGGTLASGQSCDDVCANPSIWGQNAPSSTCIFAEHSAADTSYPGQVVRCDFSQAGRPVTCVCCKD